MDQINELFLEAFSASVHNQNVTWSEGVSEKQWEQLFQMAQVHKVLPMIYEAVYACPAFQSANPAFAMMMKQQVIRGVMVQTMKTQEFRKLYEHLRSRGVTPCVVKGILCRQLYPNPDARSSGDEDVWIPAEQFDLCDEAMRDFGMTYSDPEMDIHKSYEVPYGKAGSPLYIEIHKHLFPPESEAYGDLNQYFDHEELMEVDIDGVKFLSMSHTDHLFYLICHSFKHFLHSGFGLRQVCDINMYAEAYGTEIHWDEVLKKCREIRADLFAGAMFRIGEKYLGMDMTKMGMSDSWKSMNIDEQPMLVDLLESGVYGQANMSRKHSSNITLSAVIAEKRGEKAKTSVIRSLFPKYDFMVSGYKYLEKFPFLLPVAWVQRILRYGKETAHSGKENNAGESIRIGKQRVELLREYGIVK